MSQPQTPDGRDFSRRDFLQAGGAGLGAAGLTMSVSPAPAESSPQPNQPRQAILLFLNGGPSHLDTWDPKPHALAEIRGPFSAISTRVAGIQFSEHFPLMAAQSNQFALLRSLYHEESPIHETGHQLINTGFLFRRGIERPSLGSVVSSLSTDSAANAYAVLGGRLGNTGVNVSHGQDAGALGRAHDPQYLDAAPIVGDEPPQILERYGRNSFGQNCLAARRLIETGYKVVTVNMFETVFGRTSWDCHANGGDLATTLTDYAHTVCPMFDRGFTALLSDLKQRGLLESTQVLAVGEFGRTPRLNPRGGRDHWPRVWTALAAGGDVAGGQVLGASDRHGAEPQERPIHLSELSASLYHHLGIDTRQQLSVDGRELMPLVQADPIRELWS